MSGYGNHMRKHQWLCWWCDRDNQGQHIITHAFKPQFARSSIIMRWRVLENARLLNMKLMACYYCITMWLFWVISLIHRYPGIYQNKIKGIYPLTTLKTSWRSSLSNSWAWCCTTYNLPWVIRYQPFNMGPQHGYNCAGGWPGTVWVLDHQ